MSNDISLAWVIPVDYAVLGARLEASIETRQAIVAFKLCRSHSLLQSFHELPSEIVELIIDELLDLAYIDKMKEWLQAKACSEMRCRFRDHYSEQELAEVMRKSLNLVPDTPSFHCSNGRNWHGPIYPDECGKRHQMNVRLLYAKATSSIWLGSTGGPADYFKKYKQLFYHLFGILPYFLPDPIRTSSWRTDFEEVDGISYHGQLARLISTSTLQATRGDSDYDFIYAHNAYVDVKKIQTSDSDAIAKPIQKAVDALRLNAGHTLISEADTLWDYGFDKDWETEDEGSNDGESTPATSTGRPLFCLECGGGHDPVTSTNAKEPELKVIGAGRLHVDDANDDDDDDDD